MVLRIVTPRVLWRVDAAVALGGLLLVAGLAWIVRLWAGTPPDGVWVDYDLYAHAALTLVAGGDPYAFQVPGEDGAVLYGYVYPPAVAWMVAPLALALPGRSGHLVWSLFCLVSFLASLVLLLRAFRQPVPWPIVGLVAGAATLAYAVRDNVYHGQLDLLLVLLGSGGLVLLARGRPVAAGLLLGLTASGKPFLAVLLLLLCWRQQWRATVSMCMTGALILVASFLPSLGSGLTLVDAWAGASRYAASPAFAAFPYNHALSGLWLRLFTDTPFATPWVVSPLLASLANAAIAVVVGGVWRWSMPFGPLAAGPDEAASDLVEQPGLVLLAESGLLLSLLFVFGPLSELNHFFMLLPGLVAALRLALCSPSRSVRRRWLPAAVAWSVFLLLLAGPLRVLSWGHPIEAHLSGPAVLLTGRVGFLLLAVAITVAWCRWSQRAAERARLGESPP
ncbi:MAG: DUF2029 domain-containing protein [Chloroflexi bacterium]|nr:DUF2029 domain-containing protein [Chloroflexota bacterium]